MVGADVVVNASGGYVNPKHKKDIKLSAASDHQMIKCLLGQVGVFANLLVLILLNL